MHHLDMLNVFKGGGLQIKNHRNKGGRPGSVLAPSKFEVHNMHKFSREALKSKGLNIKVWLIASGSLVRCIAVHWRGKMAR